MQHSSHQVHHRCAPLLIGERNARGAVIDETLRRHGRRIPPHFPRAGSVLRYEGIVLKRLNSLYRSGKSKAWLKLKNPKAPGYLRHAQS